MQRLTDSDKRWGELSGCIWEDAAAFIRARSHRRKSSGGRERWRTRGRGSERNYRGRERIRGEGIIRRKKERSEIERGAKK